MDNLLVKKFLFLFLLVFLAPLAYADEADMLLGGWLTAEGKSKVEVYKCGEKYCGKIVWLKIPQYPDDDPQGMAGKDKIDRENPDETLKHRPLLGIDIIQGFVYDGEAEWNDGHIYDPNNGKTYSCKMTLTDENTLEVRGYVGLSLFGRTTTWTRTKLDNPTPGSAAAGTNPETNPPAETAPQAAPMPAEEASPSAPPQPQGEKE